MGEAIYNLLAAIYANGSGNIKTYIAQVLSKLSPMITNDLRGWYSVFVGLAIGLMLIHFLIETLNQVTSELFTLEKLIKSFMQLLVGAVVCLAIPDILSAVVNFSMTFSNAVVDGEIGVRMSASTSGGIVWKFGNYSGSAFPEWSQVGDAFQDHYTFLKGIITYLALFFSAALPSLGMLIATIVTDFLVVSTALTFIIKCFIAPIAVVQIFDGGSRSTGVRYLKSIAATGMTFGAIILVVNAASYLSSSGALGFTSSTVTIGFSNIGDSLKLEYYGPLLILRFATIGAISGVQNIIREALGA